MTKEIVAVLVYVPKQLRTRLKVRAAMQGRTITALVVEACEVLLAREIDDGQS